jgi:hypothetical protein
MEHMGRSRIGARLRRGLRRKPGAGSPEEAATAAPAPAPASGLGEPPAPPRDSAGEAELDTLRGELVRELDRMADGDDGSGSFRRIAS